MQSTFSVLCRTKNFCKKKFIAKNFQIRKTSLDCRISFRFLVQNQLTLIVEDDILTKLLIKKPRACDKFWAFNVDLWAYSSMRLSAGWKAINSNFLLSEFDKLDKLDGNGNFEDESTTFELNRPVVIRKKSKN